MSPASAEHRGPAVSPRWGMRTLISLTVSIVSVITARILYNNDVATLVIPTFLGTFGGLAAAAYSSIRGLASAKQFLRQWSGH